MCSKSIGLTPMNVPVTLSEDGYSYVAVAQLETDKTYYVVERVDGDWEVYERHVSFFFFPTCALLRARNVTFSFCMKMNS